ncbi:hypothetical protein [Thermostaphylospora chromogena]|uniref:Uncharacterized protein n=1 Tax=Thermostaphylospora chromogena TaxID=35622 RepID=A0A1H1CWE2_9ACTN|nr:hypothetical protein [Thermostaphylospora chromogena]SDQ68512.1 hypothetical protein SAMN04489764_1685 [Thermostaphylospora chromogena]
MIPHLPPQWGSTIRWLLGGLLLTVALIGQAIVLLVGAADAAFGLSERQQDTCRPELWGNTQPGMAYMDVPGLPEGLVTVPGRTYAWDIGEDGQFSDEAATAAMREHAEQWPASAKNVDQWTAAVARLDAGDGTALPDGGDGGGDGQGDDEDDDDVRSVAWEYLTTDDPDPSIQAGLDDEIPDTLRVSRRFGSPRRMCG